VADAEHIPVGTLQKSKWHPGIEKPVF